MVSSIKNWEKENKNFMKIFTKTYEFEQLGFVAERYAMSMYQVFVSASRIYLYLLHRGVIEPYVGPLINIKRLKEKINELKT